MSIWLWLAVVGLVIAVGVVLYVRRKLAQWGQHLPGAIERWEEEIQNLEKPKG